MKRPPEFRLLPILGILFLLHSSNGLRATSLIFGRTTTTSTTTTEAPTEEEAVTTSTTSNESSPAPESNQTATRPPLTGIPQIDYIWDPNLPRELNGFNLTDYPFYETIPKEIDFKCDGLHDGFYASVPHKCQVYHHCLFGTRYDFLCANFTAFDQKTFICHFVSEVDCVNSPKYFHRNDALYKATTPSTTTTVTPATQRTVPTFAPAPRRPSPPGRRRRPLRRRRPQYEYYDEEYDEYETDRERDYYDEPRYQATEPPRVEGRRRRKRPRPVNRRPEYEEYDDYEDERYDRRGSGRRRPSKRREEDSDYEDEDRRRPEKIPERKPDDHKRPVDDDYDRRPYNRKSSRRPVDDDSYEENARRPYDRRQEDDDRRYHAQDSKDDRRTYDRPRKNDDEERRYRPKETKQEEEPRRYRPKENKSVEKNEQKSLIRPSSGSSVYDRPRTPPIIRRPVPLNEREKFDYKPTSTTKPKSSLPLEEEYYDDYEDELPKPQTPSTSKKPEEDISDDEPRTPLRSKRPQNRPQKHVIDETPRPQKNFESRNQPKRPLDNSEESQRPSRRPINDSDVTRKSQRRPADDESRRPFKRPLDDTEDLRKPLKRPNDDLDDHRRPQKRPIEDSEEIRRPFKRPETRSRLESDREFPNNQKHKISDEEYIDDYEENRSKSREEPPPLIRPSKYSPKDRNSESAKGESLKENRERPEPVVRVLKRPFLPSRGGNPYVGRGLQPVGAKALDTTDKVEFNDAPLKSAESTKELISEPNSFEQQPTSSGEQYDDESEEIKSLPMKKNEPIEEDFTPVTTRPKTDFHPDFRSESSFQFAAELKTTTEKSKHVENYKNPLDINENEYDVTLNDALNPTIPNLPVRSIPNGFGNSGRENYNSNYQRARFVPIEVPLASSSSDYVYQVKEPQGELVGASSNPAYATYIRSHPTDYRGQNYRHPMAASGHYYTNF